MLDIKCILSKQLLPGFVSLLVLQLLLPGMVRAQIYENGENTPASDNDSVRPVAADSQNNDRKTGLIKNEKGACRGYTLFTPENSTSTYLIDMEGRLINKWQCDYPPGQSVYLLENGHLLRTARPQSRGNQVFHAGGAGGRVQQFTWEGKLIWDYEYCNDEHCLHHDIEPLPNGNVLMIAWERKTKQQAVDAGRDPDSMTTEELWPDHIIEVKPAGKTGGKIVWQWHVWDHLIQDYDKTKPNFAVVADHPELIDINYTGGAPPISAQQWRRLQSLGYIANRPNPPRAHENNADWNHTNSISYNPKLDQIALSVHGFSEVWVIDHSTTTKQAAGHSGGRDGKGGDLLYRWGNPQAYRAGTRVDQQYFVQHDVSWIISESPGEADHLLAFNNGQRRPGGNYSSVDEIIPPVDKKGRYIHKAKTAFGPQKPVWTYTAEPKNSFFSGHISGAQRLSNGNTLICSGEQGRFFEVTSTGQIVWEYINPVTSHGPGGFGPPMGPPGMSRPGPRNRRPRDRGQGEGFAPIPMGPPPGMRGPGPHGPGNEGHQNSVFDILRYEPNYPGLAGKDLTPGEKLTDSK